MPYLRPDHVLSRFSRFVRDDVREALPAEEQFLQGQVGSMASTMDFLAGELTGKAHTLGEQEAILETAMEAVNEELGAIARDNESDLDSDVNGDIESIEEALSTARDRISNAPVPDAPETTTAREAAITNACEDVLASIEKLPDEHARTLREPVYEFLETRVQGQLRLLGREYGSDDE